jgi:hypothetical protein
MSSSFLERRNWPITMMVLPALLVTPANGQTERRLEVDMTVLASPNPMLLTGTERQAVMFELAASPGITITSPTGSTFDVGGTIRRREYSRRYGHYLLGDFRAEGRYRDSEYLSLGAWAGFNRSLAIDLLASSDDAAGDPRGIRNSWFAGADAAWRPNALTIIMPEIRFERAVYADSILLRNASALTMSLAYSRRIDPRTSIGLRARETMNDVTGMAGMNSAALFATLNRGLGPRARLLVELGVERAGRQIEWLEQEKIRRPGRILLAGRVDLCREPAERSQALSGCLSATLNSEVSGFGGLRRDGAISISLVKPLGEKFALRAVSEYRRSTLMGGSLTVPILQGRNDTNTDAIRNVVMLDWKIRPKITLTGSIQYLRRQLINGQRIGSGFVGIQLRTQIGRSK